MIDNPESCSTAVSEIARNAFFYGHRGKVEFQVNPGPPAALSIIIHD